MKFNKLISVILVFSIVLASSVLPAFAENSDEITLTSDNNMVKPQGYVSVVNEDFENGEMTNWYFRNTANATQNAVVIEENGNKFLRYTVKDSIGHVNDANTSASVLSRKFSSGAFMPDMDNFSVFEMKMRTNGADLRKYVRVNYPYPTDTTPNSWKGEFGGNTRVAISMNWGKTNGQGVFAAGLTNAPNPSWQANTTKFGDPYELNKWYTVKQVYDNANKKVRYLIYNENGTLFTDSNWQNLEAWWYTHQDSNRTNPITDFSVYDISLNFRNDRTSDTPETFDIDNIRFYNQKANVTASIVYPDESDILYRPTSVSFSFDAPVNGITNENAVVVLNSNGDVVSHTGSFDEEKLVYTATFDDVIPSGEYRFCLSSVTAKNEISAYIPTMTIANEIPFTVYSSMPPRGENLILTGSAIEGQVINADFDFISDEAEGTHIYEWSYSNSANGPFTLIGGEETSTYTVTSLTEGKYIMAKVTPVSLSGLSGNQIESNNVIAPEKAPVANDVQLSTTTPFINGYIDVEYEYFDENGDPESGTEVKLYKGDSEAGPWTEIETVGAYKITNEDLGKYFMGTVQPKNNSRYFREGAIVECGPVGPVADPVVATNLFANPGLEDGVLEPWKKTSGGEAYIGIQLYEGADAYSGSYALKVLPRYVNEQDKWAQSVSLQANKTYILSCMVKKIDAKAANVSNFEGYCWSGSVDRPYRDIEYTIVNSEKDWTRATLTIQPKASGAHGLGFVSFAQANMNLLLDDLYVGELQVSDIVTKTVAPVVIPETGTITIPVTTGEVLNQFGETDGLTEQTVTVSADAPGVTVDGNNIVVDSTAIKGTVEAVVSCVPNYKGASGEAFTKKVKIELIPNSNTKPQARNVKITGQVQENATLTGSFDFYQVEGKAGASTVRWEYSDKLDGIYTTIPNANSLTYRVTSQYADKFIRMVVTPKTVDGEKGDEVVSNVLTIPKAPYAENLKITGDFTVGGTISGSYDFVDPNYDREGTSTCKWYVADYIDSNYRPLANGKTLVLTEEMVGKYLKFAVTPVSVTAPAQGVEVKSEPVLGPAAPEVKDLEIEKDGYKLTGKYTYVHAHNAREKGTKYAWYVNGGLVSDEIEYVIDFTGTQTVTFTVIPGCASNPSTGKEYSVRLTVSGKPQSGGTGGGGGFGGGSVGGGGGGSIGGGGGGTTSGGSSSGVQNINGMDFGQNNEVESKPSVDPTAPLNDIDGHWGEAYIKEMEKRDVMKADEKGNYDPDRIVSRAEMITYLFDALKLEEAEYNAEFSDVSKDDVYAGKLQTLINNGTIASYHEFRPNDGISREEMCKILYISLENAGKLTKSETNLLDVFTDKALISDWAVDYVNTIYANKIMIGTSDVTFAPNENITRAQVATMLVRILNVLEKEA